MESPFVVGVPSRSLLRTTPRRSARTASVFSSSQTSECFVQVLCVSTDHYDCNYDYTVVDYNDAKPSGQA